LEKTFFPWSNFLLALKVIAQPSNVSQRWLNAWFYLSKDSQQIFAVNSSVYFRQKNFPDISAGKTLTTGLRS
jgi:hypothetical protein